VGTAEGTGVGADVGCGDTVGVGVDGVGVGSCVGRAVGFFDLTSMSIIVTAFLAARCRFLRRA
jgi:hypothetical protein